MVRRTQMQKQMNLSSTEADRLLKKAKKMNEEQFTLGGAGMKDDAMKKVIITKKTIDNLIHLTLDRDKRYSGESKMNFLRQKNPYF